MRRTRADAVRAWLMKARKDLETARQMSRLGSDYTDIVCFHAQQAAEKALKGYLVWLGIDFPKTHVLEDLLDLIAPRDTSLERWRVDLQALSPLAVETRYPEFGQPSLQEAQKAIVTAEQVLEHLQGALGECLG